MSRPTTAATMTEFFNQLMQVSPENREVKLEKLVPLFWQGVQEIARIFHEYIDVGEHHLTRIINVLSDDVKMKLAMFETCTDCHFMVYAKSSLTKTA